MATGRFRGGADLERLFLLAHKLASRIVAPYAWWDIGLSVPPTTQTQGCVLSPLRWLNWGTLTARLQFAPDVLFQNASLVPSAARISWRCAQRCRAPLDQPS